MHSVSPQRPPGGPKTVVIKDGRSSVLEFFVFSPWYKKC